MKVTYTAIAAAALLGAIAVGQAFVISHRHAEIRTLQSPRVNTYNGLLPYKHTSPVRPPGDEQPRPVIRKFTRSALPEPSEMP